MLSEEKEKERRNKILKVARYFLLNSNSSIEQVSEATGIPRASVHRYLNNIALKFEQMALSDVCEGNPYDTIQSLLRKLDENERKEKILKVVKYILEHRDATIEQIAESTGIPSSSVQRYLNDHIIDELKDIGIDNAYEIIQEILKNNKTQGLIKGGNTYSANNEFTKDEFGKFTGSKKH